MTAEDLAETIQYRMADTGVSLRGLAAATGVPRNTVHAWSQGERLEHAARLLTALEALGVELVVRKRDRAPIGLGAADVG